MPSKRDKPYFWVTWLTPLLAGEESCEWKSWAKGNFTNLNRMESDFDSAQWNENHTALLTKLREEYKDSAKILVEGQTSWKIEGKTAILAGKMDILTIDTNLVIDAKSGKVKDSHVLQLKTYLLAIEMGAVKGVSGEYKGILRYPNRSIKVEGKDQLFKERLFALIKTLATTEPEPIPSKNECKWCDLVDCNKRFTEQEVIHTEEF